MKMNLVLALTLVSGMAFAATGKDAKTVEKSKEVKKEVIIKQEQEAKAVEAQKTTTGKALMSDSKTSAGIDYLRKVAAKAGGNEVYEAAGGIADAAATGDQASVKVATRLAELIKSEKDVMKAFDTVIVEFKLDKKEVIENCKGGK